VARLPPTPESTPAEASLSTAPQSAYVVYTHNFEENLQAIADFWLKNDFTVDYDRLLQTLLFTIVPSLERHQKIGKPFALSFAEFNDAPWHENDTQYVQELVFSDYALLYLLPPATTGATQTIYMLAIKHQKQVAFNFIQH
jgi:hypothetical protein